eukprot:gene20347-23112_t
MRTEVILVLAFASAHAWSPLLASISWVKSSPASTPKLEGNVVLSTCNNGVCSIGRGTNDSSLHQMVLDEWKSADESSLSENLKNNTDSTDQLASTQQTSYNSTADTATLMDMGWSKEEALLALNKCDNDIVKAADLLLAKEEETDLRIARLDELVASGWQQQAAYAALEANDGNKTAAEAWLEKEEETVGRSFLVAVEDMVAHGWSEYVAREALLSQFMMNQRAANGENVTIATDILQKIRPTLRKPTATTPADSAKESNSTDTSQPAAQDSTSVSNLANSAKSVVPTKTEPALPTPAKKEDVVFQVTAANFQSLVLESPVPVVLDVYADWCGPCKQLGPVLEEAAIKAGGAFRLAKVNSDQERSLSEALGVQSLPTVFTVDNGKLCDRFVGMLPREQLQKYLVRALTGIGERVQGSDISPQALEQTGEQVASLAGAASLTFKRKEQLYTQVEAALNLPGAFVDGSNAVLTPGIKLALSCIQKSRKNIRDDTFRSIDTKAAFYQTHIASASPAAQKLLHVAGFVAQTGKSSSDAGKLFMTHSNPAILGLVSQRVDEFVRDKKFAKMRSAPTVSLPSRHAASAVPVPIAAGAGAGAAAAAAVVAQTKPAVAPEVKVVSNSVKPSSTLEERKRNIMGKDSAAVENKSKRTAESVAAPLASPRSTDATSKIPSSSIKKGVTMPKKPLAKASKVNTVFSTGIVAPKKKKFNEYFGGDSTVVSAGDEGEDDNEEENESK